MIDEPKDLSKIHPLRRRKHRRGKRGGKKHRAAEMVKAIESLPPTAPAREKVQSLRAILERLSQRKTA